MDFPDRRIRVDRLVEELDRLAQTDREHAPAGRVTAAASDTLMVSSANVLAHVASVISTALRGALERSLDPASDPARPRPTVSVVVPIHNEAENLPDLCARLRRVLASCPSYEVIFVNDGSTDGSDALIRQARSADPSIKLVNLSRSFGHQAALTAGIDHADGDAVVLMDGDLQDPPELLPQFFAKWREGYQVVYAVRATRQESWLKRVSYKVFYRLLRALADVEIPLDSGDFCLMDRSVAQHLRQMRERHRFLRGLRSWVGYRQSSVRYDRPARAAGSPKYTARKLLHLATDGLVSFTTAPLLLGSYVGVLTAIAAVGYFAYALWVKFVLHITPPGWTSLAVLVLMIGGIQLTVMGVLGAYVARIYDETKGRPSYIVESRHGFTQ